MFFRRIRDFALAKPGVRIRELSLSLGRIGHCAWARLILLSFALQRYNIRNAVYEFFSRKIT